MAIVKMSKFQLTIFEKDKAALLEALQAFDQVHLNDLTKEAGLLEAGARAQDTGMAHTELAARLSRTKQAIDRLAKYQAPPKSFVEKMSTALPELTYEVAKDALSTTDTASIIDEVHSLDSRIRAATESIRLLQEKKQEYMNWKKLDFPLAELDRIKTLQVTLGTMPQRWSEEFRRFIANETHGTYVENISSDGKLQYMMLVTNGEDENLEEILRDSNFTPVRLDSKLSTTAQIEAFVVEQEAKKREIATYEARLQALSEAHLDHLKLAYEMDAAAQARVDAEDNFVRTNYVSLLEGYVPSASRDKFEAIVATHTSDGAYELDIRDAEKDDPQVPIILKNNRLVAPFESIIQTYALPKYSEFDPTPIMMPWYMLFFGLMLGDLGYGIIMLAGSLAALKLFRMKTSTRRSIQFFMLLSIPTMIFGAIFGSVFGGLIPMPSLIDPQKDYMLMLGFSVVLGIINLLCGLAVLAARNLRDGKPLDALYDVGFWYMTLIGLILYGIAPMLGFPEMVGTISLWVAIVGMIGIVLFSARAEKGFGRFAWGAYNLYGISSYVGDIVSYTRIAALLLSGAYIGYAVNLIARMVLGAGPAGIVGAAVIVVFFHLFNLFLSALSGYVHSMRLMYVEFFGKFYEGGGVRFNGLKSDAKYIDLK